MNQTPRSAVARDLVLPTLLFMALGGMTWAIRGCSGFGGEDGCLFAGFTWGVAWWWIARDASARQSRRYASGWVVLALMVGISFSGARGWMQWPSFFDGHLQTNAGKGEFVPIPRSYGFLWLFIAGVPWAGLGACLLAWCGAGGSMRARDWVLRAACVAGGGFMAWWIFEHRMDLFMPLYHELADRYADLKSNPNLRRLINDNRKAVMHLGLYLGGLTAEAIRRDGRNCVLILTVGLLNGLGWALCQNWTWAPRFWPGAQFNFWRCWESSGGLSIGLAYGVAYFLVNRRLSETERQKLSMPPGHVWPNLERFVLYATLIVGLGVSIRCGLKGWANIYLGNEDYWNRLFLRILTPLALLGIGLAAWRTWTRRIEPDSSADLFPNAAKLTWLVLIVQNILAQLVTGPLSSWLEVAFSIYYILLLAISGTIVFHYQSRKILDQVV